ncbi:10593_t:CDS:2, partial [Gigaspora rosea]
TADTTALNNNLFTVKTKLYDLEELEFKGDKRLKLFWNCILIGNLIEAKSSKVDVTVESFLVDAIRRAFLLFLLSAQDGHQILSCFVIPEARVVSVSLGLILSYALCMVLSISSNKSHTNE